MTPDEDDPVWGAIRRTRRALHIPITPAALAHLRAGTYPVPPGCIVTNDALADALEANGDERVPDDMRQLIAARLRGAPTPGKKGKRPHPGRIDALHAIHAIVLLVQSCHHGEPGARQRGIEAAAHICKAVIPPPRGASREALADHRERYVRDALEKQIPRLRRQYPDRFPRYAEYYARLGITAEGEPPEGPTDKVE